MRAILVLLVVLIAILTGTVAGVAFRDPIVVLFKSEPQDASNDQPAVNVEVEVLRALPELADSFTLPAVIEANRVVRVSAEVAGRIEDVCCREGADCRAGDPLFELNTDLLTAEFDRAAASARRAEADLERIARLREQGAGTAQDLDKATAEMLTSKAAMELARVRLERAVIVAPIGGVLNDRLVEKGEYLQPGAPVAEIVEIDTVKVVALVPEADVPFLEVGGRADIIAEVRGKTERLEGAISYISELADEDTRSTRVEIALDNSRRLLRSGQIVRARLTRRVLRNVLLIPLAAVIPLEHGKVVYVVEDSRARRREVAVETRLIKTVRRTTPDGRVVTEQRILVNGPVRDGAGLRPGDRLIVGGHRFVAPGQPVHIRTETSPRIAVAGEAPR